MGIFKDVVDFIREDGGDSLKEINKFMKAGRDNRSMASRAKEGVLQCAVLGSKSIPMATMRQIVDVCENNYANFTRIVYSMNSTAKMGDNKGLQDYLGKFHQNINKNGGGISDVISTGRVGVKKVIGLREAMEMMETFERDTVGNFVLESVIYEKASGKIVRESREQLKSIYDGLNESILNELVAPVTEAKNRHNKRVERFIRNGSGNQYAKDTDRIKEEVERAKLAHQVDINKAKFYEQRKQDELKNKLSQNKDRRDEDLHPNNILNKQYQNAKLKAELDDLETDRLRSREKHTADMERHSSDMATSQLQRARMEREAHTIQLPKNTLLDSDAKKGNDLAPTMLQLVINVEDDNGNIVGSQEFIIGVKAVLHPIPTEEIVSNLRNVNRGKMFNFVRWTSGEISFVKDLVLNLNEIKTDVANKAKGSTGWIPALKRMSAMSRIKSRFSGKGMIPNATLVISIEEVEYIRSHYGVDVMHEAYVNKLFSELFIAGFIVVDNTSEVVHIRYDADDDFNVLSLRSLQKVNNTADFGDMIKMMNKF